MSPTDNKTSAIGYLNFGKSYLDCAMFLVNGLEERQLETGFDAPVYQLFGQTFELLFKAIILTSGISAGELKRFGHNLIECAGAAKEVDGFEDVICDINNAFKSYWRDVAISNRNAIYERTPEIYRAVINFDSDEEIDEILPDFLAVLEDLNNLYNRPFYTRYFVRGRKCFPQYEPLYLAASLLYERARAPCYNYSKAYENL